MSLYSFDIGSVTSLISGLAASRNWIVSQISLLLASLLPSLPLPLPSLLVALFAVGFLLGWLPSSGHKCPTTAPGLCDGCYKPRSNNSEIDKAS